MDVRVGRWRKLSTEELMLLNCCVGEDSWESLGLQGDPASPSWRRSVLSVHWKDWRWSWNSNTSATWCEELTHLKGPWRWERLRAGGEGTTEHEMAGWHHRLNGQEFEQAGGVGGQGRLGAAVHGVAKSLGHDWVTELKGPTGDQGKPTGCLQTLVDSVLDPRWLCGFSSPRVPRQPGPQTFAQVCLLSGVPVPTINPRSFWKKPS